MRSWRRVRSRPARASTLAGVLAGALLALAAAPGASIAATPPKHPSGKARRPAKAKIVPSEVALTSQLVARPGVAVSMSPVGLSVEYSIIAQDLGGEACGPPALASELQKLGSPPLELGGVSQDETAPAGALTGPPTSWQTANLYSLPASFWSQLHCVLAAARDPLTVGLNLRTGNLAWATAMAAGAAEAATNGVGFSIGNEPDLYGLPNYSSLAKPLPGEELATTNLYLRLAEYLRPAIGNAPVIGPELASAGDWEHELPRVIAQLHDSVVGVHAYPLSACGNEHGASIEGLLEPKIANEPSRMAWVVADAHAAGVPAIISEANSASCGGRAGVSDSPAAGVWAVRFVLSALRTGFAEVRFHFSGDPYDPFVVRAGAVAARPIESALVALNRWLPIGATLRSVPRVRELVATAIGAPTGKVLLVLDNESAKRRPVVVHTAGSVFVEELTPRFAGLGTVTLSPVRGAVRLTLARNAIAVLSPAA
jgi:hypothetical protein